MDAEVRQRGARPLLVTFLLVSDCSLPLDRDLEVNDLDGDLPEDEAGADDGGADVDEPLRCQLDEALAPLHVEANLHLVPLDPEEPITTSVPVAGASPVALYGTFGPLLLLLVDGAVAAASYHWVGRMVRDPQGDGELRGALIHTVCSPPPRHSYDFGGRWTISG